MVVDISAQSVYLISSDVLKTYKGSETAFALCTNNFPSIGVPNHLPRSILPKC